MTALILLSPGNYPLQTGRVHTWHLTPNYNGTADPEKVTLTAEFREQATKPKSAFETVMKESREHNYLKPFSEISKPSEMQGHSFSFIRTAYAATVPKEELSSESGINSTTKGGRLGRLEYRARDFSPLRQIEAATRPVRIRTKSASRFSEVRNRDHQIPIFSTSKLRSYDDFVGTKIDFMLNSTNNSVVIFEVPAIPALQTYANGWTVTSKPRLGTEKLSEFYTPAIDWRRQDFLTSFGLVGLTSFKTSDYYPIQMFGGYSDSSYVLSNSPRELYLSDYTSPLPIYNATPILPWVSQACSNTCFGSFTIRARDSYRFPHAPTINDHSSPITMSRVLATNTSETGIFRQICRAVGRSTLKVAAEAGSAIQKLRDENPRAAMLMDIVAKTPGVIQEAALHAGSKVTRTNIDKERQELSHHAQEVTSELSKLCDEYGLSKEDKAGIGSILVIFSGITKVKLSKSLRRDGTSITEKIANERALSNSRSQVSSQSVNAQSALNKKMSALENAQKDAVKVEHLSDGRIRYYDRENLSKNPGLTRGASYVTEYNPNTGQVRSWIECYDHYGNINRVHPKMLDGQDLIGQHYPPIEKDLLFFGVKR